MPNAVHPVVDVQALVLPAAIRQKLMVHLLQNAPNEGVGMLGVFPPADSGNGLEAVAAEYVAGRNIEASPTHFTMDPRDVIAAFRTFREKGLVLGAIVHSHLSGPATPSESDINEWHYPEALMLIASFAQQPLSLAAWRVVEDGDFSIVQRVPLRLIPDTRLTTGDV